MFALALLAAAASAEWVIQNRNLGTIVLGVEFSDENNGRFGGSIDGFGPAIWYTRDGGVTLEQQIDDIFTVPAAIFDMTTEGNNTVAGGLGAWFGLLGPGASYTIDDGETWVPSEDQVFFAAAYQSVETVESTTFLTGYWANATFDGYGVSVSKDGGQTYEFYDWGIAGPPGYEWPETPRYGSFLSSQVGFVAGGHWPSDSEIDLLGIKGANYALSQYVRIPVPESQLPQKTQAKATGYRAVVAKTVDGGVTWELLYDNESDYYFNQISMANETHGCAVAEGNNAYVLCTYDGGLNWETTLTVASASLVAVQFVDETYAVVGGADLQAGITAAFWESYDAGRTWARMPVVDAAFHLVFNMDMESRSVGYAAAINLGNSCSTLKFTL
eukprot:TRINITY_DN2222_c0_g4_i1.p1 TRINITY_DN2222_c0_g4~~TRINITY_DN2222_c0_g4_i1.p1  ORF type:complete len:386 (-),score=97.77 TRINITY_DN2222_c0_g4_i1:39-1196(-)